MAVADDFPLDELCAILKDYALAGAKSFKAFPDHVRRNVQGRLENKLLLEEPVIQHAISTLGKPSKAPFDGFLAAPVREDNGFRHAFFQPRVKATDASSYTLTFVVVFWVDNGDKLFAVRLEPPGFERDDAHDYAHLQFTRSVRSKDGDQPLFCTDQESWLPVSYPAFALGYQHPIHFFAGLAMSIHGFCRGNLKKYAAKVLIEALSKTSAPRSRKVLAEIEHFFG